MAPIGVSAIDAATFSCWYYRIGQFGNGKRCDGGSHHAMMLELCAGY